jgi:hypothetical protein
MNDFQKGIISLLKAALTGVEPSLPKDMDLCAVYDLAEDQQLIAALYYGVSQVPGFMSHSRYQTFFERFCVHLSHNEDQLETVKRIFDAFEEAGVDYMPVKGTLLKPLYPSPEMRTMGDADILIRMDQYPRVEEVMRSLGCRFDYESDHEYSWMTPTGLQIELHKRLIPTYNKDYYAYYGDGWNFARLCEGSSCRYEMSPEDTFVFLFTHFAKHYRDQGIGIKYVLDFYVYRQKSPDLDLAYIEGELEKLRLYEFYENIMCLLSVWFEDVPSTELTDHLTNKIFYDGVFGRQELNAISEGLKLSKSTRSVKAKKKRQLFFPSLSVMRLHYPILNKLAILLPILWIVRLADLAINHRHRYRVRMARLAQLSDENISAYQRELNYVGLDYNFDSDDPPTKNKKK